MSKLRDKLSQNNFYRQNKYVLLSMLSAFVIVQFTYLCYKLVPFGNMTILRMDLYHQYGPLFAELYDRITSHSSLIYSWNSGLGGSFLGNFFNYLSSPISIIILLFGHENIPDAIAAMICIKAVLSAGAFTLYLKKSKNETGAVGTGFGLLYAFSGYFVAYYWNVMWLDAMVLFPLIILGLEKIINKGKGTLYILTLTLMFFANYYMAYMICIFTILYFFAYYFSKYPINKKFEEEKENIGNFLFLSSITRYVIYSIFACLLASIVIFPLMTTLHQSSATSSNSPSEFKKYFDFFDFMAQHFTSTTPTIRSSGNEVYPNIYCGVLTAILAPLFLYNRKISIKEKLSFSAILAILYLSFNINYLNFVWHGFHFPNDLPYRFSYMYCFILLLMAYKTIINIRDFSAKELLTTGLVGILFLAAVEKLGSAKVGTTTLVLTLIFVIGYTAILIILNSNKYQKNAISILLLFIIFSEICVGNTGNFKMNQSKSDYTSDYNSYKSLKQQLDEYDGGFYRSELTNLRTRMDPCWYNYNGVSVFSSMANEKTSNMMSEIGLYSNYINSYTYNPNTAIFNSMFALKYIVDNSNYQLTSPFFSKILSNDNFTAYKNNYALPVIFPVNNEILDFKSNEMGNPFNVQNDLFERATGISNVMEQLKVINSKHSNISDFNKTELETGILSYKFLNSNESASITLQIVSNKTQELYLYLKGNDKINSWTATDGITAKNISMIDEAYIIDFGTIYAGIPVTVTIPLKKEKTSGNIKFYAFGLNKESFINGYNKLSDGALKDYTIKDGHIKGKINVKENETVFTSIPYDKNWNVYIDGIKLNKNEIFAINDGLLGFNSSIGEHEIELQYTNKGLVYGSLISISTFLILSIIFIIIKSRKKISKWQTINQTEYINNLSDKKNNYNQSQENDVQIYENEYGYRIELYDKNPNTSNYDSTKNSNK